MSRSFLKELSLVAGLSLVGFAGTAEARPDAPPPGVMRNEISMHARPDVRGDRDFGGGSGMRVVHEQSRFRPDSTILPREKHLPIPIKNDILMQVSGGDRDGAATKSKITTKAVQSSLPSTLILPREQHIPIPIKTDILMQVQVDKIGDSGGNKASSGGAGNRGNKDSSNGQKTDKAKEDICKHTGICMPNSQGSDSIDDKTK